MRDGFVGEQQLPLVQQSPAGRAHKPGQVLLHRQGTGSTTTGRAGRPRPVTRPVPDQPGRARRASPTLRLAGRDRGGRRRPNLPNSGLRSSASASVVRTAEPQSSSRNGDGAGSRFPAARRTVSRDGSERTNSGNSSRTTMTGNSVPPAARESMASSQLAYGPVDRSRSPPNPARATSPDKTRSSSPRGRTPPVWSPTHLAGEMHQEPDWTQLLPTRRRPHTRPRASPRRCEG
jgi:hypothetical protein